MQIFFFSECNLYVKVWGFSPLFTLMFHAVVIVACRGPLPPHPVCVSGLGWMSLRGLCMCVFEYVLESRIRQWFIGRGHLGAAEGPFAQRSAGWQTSSPFNLFNTGLSVKIPTNRVFVLFLSKMALLLIIPLHLQDSQAIHRIPQQLTCRSHTPASGASSPA